mmetsp:Transcript_44259/g.102231  ORF Transcript_44259/g.102231 Transcript_44259/m.102231 type:complete len:222 (+) Transcript_44259:1678-2343(+)
MDVRSSFMRSHLSVSSNSKQRRASSTSSRLVLKEADKPSSLKLVLAVARVTCSSRSRVRDGFASSRSCCISARAFSVTSLWRRRMPSFISARKARQSICRSMVSAANCAFTRPSCSIKPSCSCVWGRACGTCADPNAGTNGGGMPAVGSDTEAACLPAKWREPRKGAIAVRTTGAPGLPSVPGACIRGVELMSCGECNGTGSRLADLGDAPRSGRVWHARP